MPAVSMDVTPEAKKHARAVSRLLKKHYGDAECALNYSNPLELLVATILSAQCTDERVNIVTETLFQKYHSAADYALADPKELQRDIQSTGFFRNKAKNIQGACRVIAEKYDGQVPPRLAALVQLPGVGRKTANVVLGTAFGITSGVVVDTHVSRLSKRLGLTTEENPEKIELNLMALLPRTHWVDFSHRMIHHGRRICKARKPNCGECPFAKICPQEGVLTADE